MRGRGVVERENLQLHRLAGSLLTSLPVSGTTIPLLSVLFWSGLPISTVLNAAVHQVIEQRCTSPELLRAFSFDAAWRGGVAMIAKLAFAGSPMGATLANY